jgi:hypothetical protein
MNIKKCGLYKEYTKEETDTFEKLYPSDYFSPISTYETKPIVIEHFDGDKGVDLQMGNSFGVVFTIHADESTLYRRAQIYAADKVRTYYKCKEHAITHQASIHSLTAKPCEVNLKFMRIILIHILKDILVILLKVIISTCNLKKFMYH